jgi:hypothetical protein
MELLLTGGHMARPLSAAALCLEVVDKGGRHTIRVMTLMRKASLSAPAIVEPG